MRKILILLGVVAIAVLVFAMHGDAKALTWTQINNNGFGEGSQRVGLEPIIWGDYMYVGLQNLSTGAQVWRSKNGTVWEKVLTNGLNNTGNSMVGGFGIYNGALYGLLSGQTLDTKIIRTHNGTDWEQVGSGGLGDTRNNYWSYAFAEFEGHFYVSLSNISTGVEIWRTSNGTDWSQVSKDGFGDANNLDSRSMYVYNGYLYAGTWNALSGGGEIWRTANGTDWTRTVDNGFNDGNNIGIWSLGKLGDYLYAATYNVVTGVEMWRSTDGQTWNQVNANGFGNANNYWPSFHPMVVNDTMYIGVRNDVSGAQIWSTTNGTNWTSELTSGNGDIRDYAVYGMAVWGDRMYAIGSSNTAVGGTGVKVWRSEKIDPLKITTTSLPNASVGKSYGKTLDKKRGTSPFSLEISDGQLPEGLSLNSRTSRISGTPTKAETQEFTVKVTDDGMPAQVVEKTLSLRVVGGVSTSNYIITGTGDSAASHIRAFTTNGKVEKEPNKLFPYGLAARVGTNVAAGDVNGDGVDEIITAPRDGGPYVRVFKKDGKAYGAGIWAFPRNARGSFDVAAGDVNGDGKDEIIVSKSEGKSTVKIFKYDAKKTLVKEFDALGSINVGVRVAAGDVDNDGKAEVIVGAGKGGDAIVRVFESNGKAKKIEFYAYAKGYRDGIDVAAGDTDGDGKAEIAVSKLGKQSLVKVFRYNKANKVLGEWTSYGAAAVGSYVAMGDIDSDGKAEVVTIAAEGGAPYVRGYEKNGVFKKSLNFYAYGKNARIGGDVAFGAF